MSGERVLVVEDDRLVKLSVTHTLRSSGYEVEDAESGRAARGKFEQPEPWDLVFLDHILPDCTGMELLRDIKSRAPATAVVLMTGHSTIEIAVEAMRLGAFHFLQKPFSPEELVTVTADALERTRLRREVRDLRLQDSFGFDAVIGDSPPMRRVKALSEKIARSKADTVLLLGESGTGKDVLARAIHAGSDRADEAFVNITCSAIPETLLESELFGHERGAFTDARQRKPGLFEKADKGTLFLDEIGELPMTLQSKLLRFLEERAFRRVGGTDDLHVDVRVIAATNRDLAEGKETGAFRPDLYYRLRVVPIEVPPLRDRGEDVRLLTLAFVESYRDELGLAELRVTEAALKLLAAHSWPGNVRELKNAVERAALLAEGSVLDAADFDIVRPQLTVPGDLTLPAEGVDLEQLEIHLLQQALARCGGNRTRAAALLGMNRDQIRYRIMKYELEGPVEP